MKQEDIDKKINAALESLEGVQRATPAPYLLTRINARLTTATPVSVWSKVFSFMSRPAFAVMGLFFVLLINMIIIFTGSLNLNSSSPSIATSGNGVYEMAINVSSTYDIENSEP